MTDSSFQGYSEAKKLRDWFHMSQELACKCSSTFALNLAVTLHKELQSPEFSLEQTRFLIILKTQQNENIASKSIFF